jgi:N-glycosylase/DNA lyase
MHEFKFLSKNNTTSYNGQMSREAIEFLNGYLDHGGFEITTTIATYKMADYTYGSEGTIVAGTINAYPLDAPNIRITFKIRDGEITQHLINIDYWNTMGQLVNAIRRED